MSEKTVRDFTVGGDIGPIVDAWAGANHFGFQRMEGPARVYQRGSGFLTGIMMVTIAVNGNQVRLETWIHATLPARIGALFLIPSNTGVESGGVRGVIPRRMCRDAVNGLLAQLNQPPIP